jgi:hypothetical protein
MMNYREIDFVKDMKTDFTCFLCLTDATLSDFVLAYYLVET